MAEKYLLGLDLGTDSVGWCLTDENYHVIRKSGKSLWGVRLFEEAKDASERRQARSGRRRTLRRKERIRLLQELFVSEMDKVDPGFFQRLELSKYHFEDRKNYFDSVQTLFVDKKFTDKEYYKKFPTIYHLRRYLMESKKKEDLRFVYLAAHHIIKYRGNFLYPGASFKVMDRDSIGDSFQRINDILKDLEKCEIDYTPERFEDIRKLIEKDASVSGVKEGLIRIFNAEDAYLKKVIFPLIAGATVTIKAFYELEDDEGIDIKKISFKDADADTNIENLIHGIDRENYNTVLLSCKSIYDAFLIGRLLKEDSHLSDAMVRRYDQHKEDLEKLKNYVRNTSLYDRIFRIYDEKLNNYPHYIGSNRVKNKGERFKRCRKDDFYKFLRTELKLKANVPTGDAYLDEINKKMSDGSFLDRQNSSENGVFPMQMNLEELKIILKQQSEFYPFLREKDENGLECKEKIVSILKYHIPYFIGPLAQSSSFSWIVRKKEKIFPWNFDKVVDYEKSAEAFIKRMMNRCTYLPDEFCLPKNSIVFGFYSLLSEINKIALNGRLITPEQKKELIEDLFLKKTVTKKSLQNYFKYKYGQDVLITTSNEKELEEIHTNLKSYHTFCNIFGEDYVRSHIEQIDEMIRDITLFSDKEILRKRFEREYRIEDKIILQKLSTLTYQGYGRLSGKLLTGITAPVVNIHTGEVIEKNILQIMMDTNQNLMEILNNSEYPFRRMIEEEQLEEIKNESIDEYVNRLYVSPGMKRPLIQSYRIIEELKQIIRHPIDSYYIECTRSNEQKKGQKESRKTKLLQLYQKAIEICKKETEKSISILELEDKKHEIEEKTEDQFRSDKLYLYFLQMGRCMYTNKPLSIEDVYSAAMCDIDHIIPQAILKDDSIENRVLVLKSANAYKSDRFPIPSNQLFEGHRAFYKMLKEYGFIDEKKFHNLSRSDELSSQELEQFVNRQLVYTNQAVSALVQMIRHFENVSETDVVYSKAENVSHFRKQYGLLKSREANDYHHAHDAFLNIVVGRSLSAYYGFRMTGDTAKKYRSQDKTLNIDKILHPQKVISCGNQIVWNGKETIDHVKKQIETRFDILMTTRQYVGHNLFEHVSLIPASKAKGEGLYPMKNPTDPSDVRQALKDTFKYGGYNNLANGYYCLVESEDKKGKKIVSIEAMQNVYVSPDASIDKKLEYLKKIKKLQNPEILHPLLRINFVLQDGKSKYCITGKTGDRLLIKNLSPMIIDQKSYGTIRKIEKFLNIITKGKMDLLNPDKNNLNERFPICEHQIIISPAANQNTKTISLTEQEINDLYQLLLQKMNAPIYESFSQFQSLYRQLTSEEKTDRYSQLNMYQKIYLIYELLHLFQCNRVLSDLQLLDLSKTSGILYLNKNLKNQKIIQESVTGFYSKVIFDGKKR